MNYVHHMNEKQASKYERNLEVPPANFGNTDFSSEASISDKTIGSRIYSSSEIN